MALGPQHLTQGLLFNKHMTHAGWTDESVDSVCNTYCEPHLIGAQRLCFYALLTLPWKWDLRKCAKEVWDVDLIIVLCLIVPFNCWYYLQTIFHSSIWPILRDLGNILGVFLIVLYRYWHFKARAPGWVLNLCSSSLLPNRNRTVTPFSLGLSVQQVNLLRHSSSPSAFLPTSASLRSHSAMRCRGARLPVPFVQTIASPVLTFQYWLPSDPVF